MIQEKVYSIRISELISTAIILVLVIVFQEASWLENLLLSSPTSISNIQLEKTNQSE